MTSSILAYKVAQICAQPHIRDCGFLVAPFLDRKPFEQDETLAVEKLLTNGCKEAGKAR